MVGYCIRHVVDVNLDEHIHLYGTLQMTIYVKHNGTYLGTDKSFIERDFERNWLKDSSGSIRIIHFDCCYLREHGEDFGLSKIHEKSWAGHERCRGWLELTAGFPWDILRRRVDCSFWWEKQKRRMASPRWGWTRKLVQKNGFTSWGNKAVL